MKNNKEKTIIHCLVGPFDCVNSHPINTDCYRCLRNGSYSCLQGNINSIPKHLCNLEETDCEHAFINIKEERKEKLKQLKS